MLTINSDGMPAQAQADMASTPGADFDFLATIHGVRTALGQEQRNRCAYCERTLTSGKTKIEHFHPRAGEFGAHCATESGAPTAEESRTSWSNLLLVCTGGENAYPEMRTCDTTKADTDICGRVHNPKRKNLSIPTQVTCAHSGRLLPITTDTDAQYVVDTVLNLNADHLVAARKELVRQLHLAYAKVRAPNKTSAKAKQLRDRLENSARTKEFGSVYLTFAAKLENR